LPLLGIEPQFVHTVHSLVIILTELSQLRFEMVFLGGQESLVLLISIRLKVSIPKCLSEPKTIYRVSQEKCARLGEGVPYVIVYRYNPKHLCPKLNSYGDNGQRKVWSSGRSTHCTCQLTFLSVSVLECGVILWQFSSH